MEKPIYPKEDPEYRNKILQDFYRKIKNTNWGKEEEETRSTRGRKPSPPPKPMVDMDIEIL